jgi:hypothetical protein
MDSCERLLAALNRRELDCRCAPQYVLAMAEALLENGAH